ncbi:MAG: RPA12/RPB9/RPC11 RNA polymerase family protein [Thermoplasmatota archaeon]
MFCPEDKTMLRPIGSTLTCPKCGYKQALRPGLVVKGPPEERRLDKFSDLGAIDDPAKFKIQIHPIDDQVWCGKCGNRGAYYYLRQTRRADEPTTRFYECTKCGARWKTSK